MFIGCWNKSVIMTYLGMICSLIGISLLIISPDYINQSICLLMMAGIFDLFDGAVARKCKRTQEEKEFGVQLDSLADVVSSVIYPVVILYTITPYKILALLVGSLFGICGVCRLAYFNLSANADGPVKYYTGLPVTSIAFLVPIVYLFKYVFSTSAFSIFYLVAMAIIGIFYILNIKIPKPKRKAYVVFSLLFVIALMLYLVIL